MLTEQRKHPVISHDRWFLIQQMVFQCSPIQAQRLEEKPVRVVLGETHLAHSRRHIQPQVFDKPCGSDKTVQ